MQTNACNQPESLSYLPAYFRAEVEHPAVLRGHPLRWFLQIFESNLQLAESIVENSRSLFDPAELALHPRELALPEFLARDFVDASKLLAELGHGEHRLSRHLRENHEYFREIGDASGEKLAEDLAKRLNRVIRGPSLLEKERFAGVRFTPETRLLISQAPKDERVAWLNRLLLQDAYSRHLVALPSASMTLTPGWEVEQLRWVASWIGLELDEDWLQDESGDKSSSARSDSYSTRHYVRACEVMAGVAELYRRRGTPSGLEDMIRLCYGLEVEIIERSDLQGMRIGVTSCIGVDTCLMDESGLDQHFVVLIKAHPRNRRLLPDEAERVELSLAGESAGRPVEWYLGARDREAPGTDLGINARAERAIRKLQTLLDHEAPAHLRYTLAFEGTRPPSPTVQWSPMVIEVDSVVGGFQIN